LKRTLDLLASFFGLLFLSPFFLVISLLIRNDSRGHVLFRGHRIGQHGKEFEIYKFRTMYENPEGNNGLPLTTKDDKRVTNFGRWLRDTKINELPQLWNVLIGEMSLVGPRPEDPDIVNTWPEDVRKEVLSVRPGMTSPASIIYRDEEQLLTNEGAMDLYLKQILPEKQRLDQLYIKNRNIFGDLDVIFMTLIVLIPRMRTVKINEKLLFSSPLSNFFNRYLTWFTADFMVAFFAIGITGLAWRIKAPLNWGIGRAVLIAIGVAFLTSSINYFLGLGRIRWRYASPIYVLDLFLSTGLTILILAVGTPFLLGEPLLSTGQNLNFGLLTFTGLVIIRYRERLLFMLANRWMIFRGKAAKMGARVLIVGAGDSGQLTAWLLHKSIYSNWFSIVGFVDDDYQKLAYKKIGYPVLGNTNDITDVVEKKNIGLIFFSISKCPPVDRERILSLCRSTNARVAIIPDLNEVLERSLMELNIELQQ
jgi:lipopolysaccharide/colanic/teichoic acid biosynthesis glycosyltransferase